MTLSEKIVIFKPDMNLHTKLTKKYVWYQKWHNFRHVQAVHYVIFAIFAGYNFYLALELQQLVKIN